MRQGWKRFLRRRRVFDFRHGHRRAFGKTLAHVLVGDDHRAVFAEWRIPADVIAVIMRIDEEAHGLLRDGGDRGLELVVHLRELAVHHDDAVVAGGNRRVTAEAFKHIGAVAEIESLHLDLRPVGSDGRAGRLLAERGRGKTGRGNNGDERDPPMPPSHNALRLNLKRTNDGGGQIFLNQANIFSSLQSWP